MVNTPVYPVFGEVLMTHDSSPDNHGFSDTSLTQRGLLPMSMSNSDDRSSVREYDGPGMVMNSKVACMRPVIDDATLVLDYTLEYRKMQGVFDYDRSVQEARPGTEPLCSSSNDCEQVAFECILPGVVILNSTETRAVGGCSIDGVGGQFRGPSRPT